MSQSQVSDLETRSQSITIESILLLSALERVDMFRGLSSSSLSETVSPVASSSPSSGSFSEPDSASPSSDSSDVSSCRTASDYLEEDS